VPVLLTAYRTGRVAIANAVGTGIADDKPTYPQVPTWILRRPDDLEYALAHLPELVVEEVHGAGGGGAEAMTALVSVSATPDRTPREQPKSRQMQQRQAQQ